MKKLENCHRQNFFKFSEQQVIQNSVERGLWIILFFPFLNTVLLSGVGNILLKFDAVCLHDEIIQNVRGRKT